MIFIQLVKSSKVPINEFAYDSCKCERTFFSITKIVLHDKHNKNDEFKVEKILFLQKIVRKIFSTIFLDFLKRKTLGKYFFLKNGNSFFLAHSRRMIYFFAQMKIFLVPIAEPDTLRKGYAFSSDKNVVYN